MPAPPSPASTPASLDPPLTHAHAADSITPTASALLRDSADDVVALAPKRHHPQPLRPGHARVDSAAAMSKYVEELAASNDPEALAETSISHPERDSDLRSNMASPVMPEVHPSLGQEPTTEVRAGFVQKSFRIPTSLLVQKSPFFAAMQSTDRAIHLTGPFLYPDLDEFAFAIFVRWIHGGQLNGPSDFHSMQHYLCLYVLAARFDIEELKNRVVDAVRDYYRIDNMTAPAYRLEYIYHATNKPNFMRQFLVSTAAYRSLADLANEGGLSSSMSMLLAKGGELAPDFAASLCTIVKRDFFDARHGDPCHWHEHERTPKCPVYHEQPWEAN